MNRAIPMAAAVVWALACGGESATPDGVCKHLFELAKKVKPDVSVDDAQMSGCVNDEKKLQARLGEAKYGELAKCVVAAGDVMTAAGCESIIKGKPAGGAAGGEEAFDDYASKSKSTEARINLHKLYAGARTYLMESAAFPEPSAGPTPPLGACCKQSGECAPEAALWTAAPWTDLDFSVDDPSRYSYEYKVDNAAHKLTVSAYGDLDCDGTYSTFTMTSAVSPDGMPGQPELTSSNELE